MVGANSQGDHILYSVSDLQRAIGSVTGKQGQLMTGWQQGLDAFYATPPQYSAAQSAFKALSSSYADFGGVQPFASAAAQGTGDIPALTNANGAPTTPRTPGSPLGVALSKQELFLVVGLALLLAVLLGLVFFLRRRSARQRATAQAQGAALARGGATQPAATRYAARRCARG